MRRCPEGRLLGSEERMLEVREANEKASTQVQEGAGCHSELGEQEPQADDAC